jgi:DNA recombination protein RmuC
MKPELILFLLSAVILFFALFLLFAVWRIMKGAKRDEALPEFFSAFGSVKSIVEILGQEQKGITNRLEEAHRALLALKTEYEAKREYDRQASLSLKKIEEVIAGTKSKGIAGENILRQALSVFPADMVAKDIRIKGKEVEFGFVLTDKKIVPIDSKWAASELIEGILRQENEDEKKKLIGRLDSELAKRVAEVTQYIDPELTVAWAICAVPDSVFTLCQDAHLAAFKKNVILISYSLALPYLLTLYRLHWQYSTNAQFSDLGHYLMDAKRNLDGLDDILENRVVKALVMLKNAADASHQYLAGLRQTLNALEKNKFDQGAKEKKADEKISHLIS